MTIREFIEREKESMLAKKLTRNFDFIEASTLEENRNKPAYEIKGILYGLLYSGYITTEEYENLMEDWNTLIY